MKKAIKILVADENATERQALCNELRRAGFTNLLEAGNGEEALIQIGKNHPDIAIVDVWLSKLDGIGVLRNTQSLKFAPDKPPAFIVVSMVSKQSIFIEAANAGADLCLLKPYNVESFGESSYLVRLYEDCVTEPPLDTRFEPFHVSYEQVVTDEHNFLAERGGHLAPAVEIVLGKSVLYGDYRIGFAECLVVAYEGVGGSLSALFRHYIFPA